MERMTIEQAAEWLRKRDNFLILTHIRPDGDTVGCAAALCEGLRALGKTAYALQNPDLTADFTSYLPPCYAPDGFEPDFVVSVDVASLGLLPKNAAPYRERIDLAIDHHPSNEGFSRDGLCLYSECAATGEIIFQILSRFGDTVITPACATALYCAVATDTGCFVYDNTTAQTHEIAALLMKSGADYKTVNKRHFRTKSRARIALESAVLSSIEYRDEGRIAVVTLTQAFLRSINATEDDLDSIASLSGTIEGVDCALTVRELADGQSKISLRTGARVNATNVCRQLGGGGHAQAAGATLSCPLDEAKRRALDAIAKVTEGGAS